MLTRNKRADDLRCQVLPNRSDDGQHVAKCPGRTLRIAECLCRLRDGVDKYRYPRGRERLAVRAELRDIPRCRSRWPIELGALIVPCATRALPILPLSSPGVTPLRSRKTSSRSQVPIREEPGVCFERLVRLPIPGSAVHGHWLSFGAGGLVTAEHLSPCDRNARFSNVLIRIAAGQGSGRATSSISQQSPPAPVAASVASRAASSAGVVMAFLSHRTGSVRFVPMARMPCVNRAASSAPVR